MGYNKILLWRRGGFEGSEVSRLGLHLSQFIFYNPWHWSDAHDCQVATDHLLHFVSCLVRAWTCFKLCCLLCSYQLSSNSLCKELVPSSDRTKEEHFEKPRRDCTRILNDTHCFLVSERADFAQNQRGKKWAGRTTESNDWGHVKRIDRNFDSWNVSCKCEAQILAPIFYHQRARIQWKRSSIIELASEWGSNISAEQIE